MRAAEMDDNTRGAEDAAMRQELHILEAALHAYDGDDTGARKEVLLAIIELRRSLGLPSNGYIHIQVPSSLRPPGYIRKIETPHADVLEPLTADEEPNGDL